MPRWFARVDPARAPWVLPMQAPVLRAFLYAYPDTRYVVVQTKAGPVRTPVEEIRCLARTN